jgi:hypothetical protein
MQSRTMRPEADWWRWRILRTFLRSELAIGRTPTRPSGDILRLKLDTVSRSRHHGQDEPRANATAI